MSHQNPTRSSMWHISGNAPHSWGLPVALRRACPGERIGGWWKVLSERTFPDILKFALHKANNNSVSRTSIAQRTFIDRSHSSPEEIAGHLILMSSPPVKNSKGSRFRGNFSGSSTHFKSTTSLLSSRGMKSGLTLKIRDPQYE
jgi:hypothetical protein